MCSSADGSAGAVIQATRVLLALDVALELWLWMGLICTRSGAAFDCWVPRLLLTGRATGQLADTAVFTAQVFSWHYQQSSYASLNCDFFPRVTLRISQQSVLWM